MPGENVSSLGCAAETALHGSSVLMREGAAVDHESGRPPRAAAGRLADKADALNSIRYAFAVRVSGRSQVRAVRVRSSCRLGAGSHFVIDASAFAH